MELTLVHLYPDLMNIYGDRGNIAALAYRCRQRKINLKVKAVSVNDRLTPGSFDLLFAGGGQDRQQIIVSRDLKTKAKVIHQAADADIPMLTICGSYQLFGEYFQPFSGPKLSGIGLFKAYTIASKKRKIGNILVQSRWGELVGFENHSGNTWLKDKNQALGQVIHGFGNNGHDQTEGAIYNHALGCYLHGSLLPKNPHLADYLIRTALEIKYKKTIKLQPLNDEFEWQAHRTSAKIGR